MRWDLLALLPVMIGLGFVILKYAKSGKAGRYWIYFVWAVSLAFEIYWAVTGQLF